MDSNDIGELDSILHQLAHGYLRGSAYAEPYRRANLIDDLAAVTRRLAARGDPDVIATAMRMRGDIAGNLSPEQKGQLDAIVMSAWSQAHMQSDVSPDTDARWAEDPYQRHQYRYWDGRGWTEHVSDNGTQQIDPLSPLAPEGTSHAAVRYDGIYYGWEIKDRRFVTYMRFHSGGQVVTATVRGEAPSDADEVTRLYEWLSVDDPYALRGRFTLETSALTVLFVTADGVTTQVGTAASDSITLRSSNKGSSSEAILYIFAGTG